MEYSVIINVKNGQNYLSRAVDQILKQTLLPKKIIIFNNASIDNTDKLANELKKKYSDLILIKDSKKPLTLYAARNKALSFAITKYVCFLDVDDIWQKLKSQTQINLFAQNPDAIICISNYKKVFEYEFDKFEYSEEIINLEYAFSKNFFRFIKEYEIHFSSIMFDREKLISILGAEPFNPRLTILGDIEIFIKLFALNKLILSKQNLTCYVYHQTNTGYKNYHRITLESIFIAIDLLLKLKIIRAFYIVYLYNYKYLLFLISKISLLIRKC